MLTPQEVYYKMNEYNSSDVIELTLLELGNNPFPMKGVKNGNVFIMNNKQEFTDLFKESRNPILEEINSGRYSKVIEFGSGWGRNLLYLFEQKCPKNLKYYGLEYTEQGLLFNQKIHNNLYNDYDLTLRRFDYLNSNDILDLADKNANILCFSCWSIEQITLIPEIFFQNVLQLGKNITFIHLEPIGWQLDYRALCKNHWDGFSQYYNKNLFNILKKLEQDKLIQINKCILNFSTPHNPDVCATLIKWNSIPISNDFYKNIMYNENEDVETIIIRENKGFPIECVYDNIKLPIYDQIAFNIIFKMSREPILSYIQSKTYNKVIEFGSGWGKNIFYLFQNNCPKDIDYYALECIPEGIEINNKLYTKKYANDYKLKLQL